MSIVLAALYVPTLVLGFVAVGSFSKPLEDPFLGIAEVLIILMAPGLLGLAAGTYLAAPPDRRVFGLVAFGCMLLAVGITTSVHVIELTVARRLGEGALVGPTFGWTWPSVLYGLDAVAWDLFFGLSLLCIAAVHTGRSYRWVRWGFLVAGALSVIGLAGLFSNEFGLRTIGIVGYAVVFPLACVALTRALGSTANHPVSALGTARATVRSR